MSDYFFDEHEDQEGHDKLEAQLKQQAAPTEDTPTLCRDCGQEAHAVPTTNPVCTTLTAGGKYIGLEPKQDSLLNSTMPVKPVSSKADYASEQDDKLDNSNPPAQKLDKSQQDDVNIKFFNQGFRLGQIQLVSELLTYGVELTAESTEEGYRVVKAVPTEILEHKKQELERGK